MDPYIYLIHDKVKNKICYGGKHNGTVKNYITSGKILNRYIRIWGLDSFLIRFEKKIIEYCDINLLNAREEHWVSYYKTYISGLNLTKGGNYDWKYKIAKKKPVLQYSLSGEFIKDWESAKEASNILKISNSDIGACCLGKQKSSSGFIWKFKEKHSQINKFITPIKRKTIINRKPGRFTPISNNNIIYDSKSEYKRLTGISELKLISEIKKGNVIEYVKLLLNEDSNEKFKTILEASKKYNIPKSTLTDWIKKYPNSNLKLKWMYEVKSKI